MRAMVLESICELAKNPEPLKIEPEVERYPLEEANRALVELRTRRVRGAKVLEIARAGRAFDRAESSWSLS